ncbi:hypothetical protein GQ600_7592 [Phytophthora cactorum]|nr:hypothetical protein GQ600_7592 [Phytophthora cactorum]
MLSIRRQVRQWVGRTSHLANTNGSASRVSTMLHEKAEECPRCHRTPIEPRISKVNPREGYVVAMDDGVEDNEQDI